MSPSLYLKYNSSNIFWLCQSPSHNNYDRMNQQGFHVSLRGRKHYQFFQNIAFFIWRNHKEASYKSDIDYLLMPCKLKRKLCVCFPACCFSSLGDFFNPWLWVVNGYNSDYCSALNSKDSISFNTCCETKHPFLRSYWGPGVLTPVSAHGSGTD